MWNVTYPDHVHKAHTTNVDDTTMTDAMPIESEVTEDQGDQLNSSQEAQCTQCIRNLQTEYSPS